MPLPEIKLILIPYNNPEIDALRKELLRLIQIGNLKFEFRRMDSNVPSILTKEHLKDLLDTFVGSWGGFAIDRSWKFINQETAFQIVDAILAQDMAYNSERMKQEEALRITGLFFKLFPKPLYFATNGTLGLNHAEKKKDSGIMLSSSWIPVTPATFDTGVIVISADVIGMLWMLDED